MKDILEMSINDVTNFFQTFLTFPFSHLSFWCHIVIDPSQGSDVNHERHISRQICEAKVIWENKNIILC